MKLKLLRGHKEKKATREVLEYARILKRQENKKVLDTMLSMASIGKLTPERYAFFMTLISNQRIGENDVQEYIFRRSSERNNLTE